jgi:3-hydroxymyristoyl/3-hydroxydecanoyl-(acyl carrier protein) dehydratase
MNYIDFKNYAQLNTPTYFSAQYDIFNHHFPDKPLLPGALSALLIAESCGGPEWFLSQIEGLRFRKPLTPDLPITISCELKKETETEKVCLGKITSADEVLADGEFTFTRNKLAHAKGSRPEYQKHLRTAQQIREYLPHGEPIVLIDQLVRIGTSKPELFNPNI